MRKSAVLVYVPTAASVLAVLVLLLAAAAPLDAQSGPPPSAAVTFEVRPEKSTSFMIMPTAPGMSNNRIYLYDDVAAGTSIVDSIPVKICITSQSGTWNSFSVEFAPEGTAGNLSGVTLPDDVTFTSAEVGSPLPMGGFCKTATILVNSGALSDIDPDVDYTKNILVREKQGSADPSMRFNITRDGGFHVKIQVRVVAPTVACFASDSDFNFLLDCTGGEVKSGDGGRFAIVVNRRGTQVATNPGQFYFNFLWRNTSGSSKTVSVNFMRTGVIPKGAQAIHARVFAPPFVLYDDATVDNFNLVNDEMPSGSDDVLETVTVPAGYTLWVTYHLEWAGLGFPAPASMATVCSLANQAWSVKATLGGDASGECTAGARGYRK